MSTTGGAADTDGDGQRPVASSSADAASNLPSPDLMKCDECGKCSEKFCLHCEAPVCAKCDTEVVHTSRTTRNHQRMMINDYLLVVSGLGSSSATDDQMDVDADNKFCCFSPLDHSIRLLPRLASLVEDPQARPSLVSFVGPTGVGKSTLLRLLISLDGDTDAKLMPLAGAPNDAQSTSADIHMYASAKHSQAQSGDGSSTYPLLYMDSEGSGGSKEPRAIQRMWNSVGTVLHGKLGNYESFENRRIRHVQVSYPRMLYIFSDVLCFVFQGNWRERDAIMKPLLEWGKTAAVGVVNQHRPQLILVFNKTGKEAEGTEFDDFRKASDIWFEGDKNRNREELRKYYWEPLVVLVPQKDINAVMFLKRVKKLHNEIRHCTSRIRAFRAHTNQLFTRRQLQVFMQLAADTFTKNPNEDFDIYKAIMARRPTSVGLAGYVVEFLRAVEEAASREQSTSELSNRWKLSLSVLQARIKVSVRLWIGRQHMGLAPFGASAQLPEELRTALTGAQRVIDGALPCAAFDHGNQCEKVKLMHESDDMHVARQARWRGAFSLDPAVKDAADACRLVYLAESTLQNTPTLDVTDIRKELLQVRESERDKYQWLKDFTSYRVCLSCIVELPTEVLSCGHIICAMCAKEEANAVAQVSSPIDLKCPVCLSPAKWYPKDLPPLAGYRILSLDGGGVRGIVELLSLAKIMSFFPEMNVKDLFDVIVGTSTGGIIALALTVHKLEKQPKRLPEVIELFQEFSTKVFSGKMMRPLADYSYILRLCQALRIYDTKYKNDNLLKLLEKHFGAQLMLDSCAGGPHVIITSCERDDKHNPAWFTSYNRPTLENESDDLSQPVLREKNEKQTRKVHGRVLDNHSFSVKDAAAATSAAGTYFPAYEACGRTWVDGGFLYNGPPEVAIKEARLLWPKRKASALISLGSGRLLKDEKVPLTDGLLSTMTGLAAVLTDAESQCIKAIEHLQQLQPDSEGCFLRLNPTISVPKGEKCGLDSAEKIPFLMEATKRYLNGDGRAGVQQAANVLFAALFYLDVEIEEGTQDPKLDTLRIRSRRPLPLPLQGALIHASRSPSPPFTVALTMNEGGECTLESQFRWENCWDQNFMNLPFNLNAPLMLVGPPTVVVKLHMCLPETTAPKDWSLPISGMPCRLGAPPLRSNSSG